MLTGTARAFWRALSPLGLVLGVLFFAVSLTPSLIPRSYLFQGVPGGVSFALGYGVGILGGWLWRFLELPTGSPRLRRIATAIAAACAAAIVGLFLSWAAEWQNAVRERVQLPPVDTAHPLQVALIAVTTALLLIVLGWFVVRTSRFAAERIDRLAPSRAARLLGMIVVLVLFGMAVEGVLVRSLLQVADSSFQTLDSLLEPGIEQPTDRETVGGPGSLVSWEDLGRTGRESCPVRPPRRSRR